MDFLIGVVILLLGLLVGIIIGYILRYHIQKKSNRATELKLFNAKADTELSKKEAMKFMQNKGYYWTDLLNRAYLVERGTWEKEGKGDYFTVNDLSNMLGINDFTNREYDRHYSVMTKYGWHRPPGKGRSAGYSPIYGRIEKLIDVLPDEKQFLETIHRKLVYLETRIPELEYLVKKYNWELVPICFEYFNSNSEVILRSMLETFRSSVKFHGRHFNHPNMDVDSNKFVEYLVALWEKCHISQLFSSINDSLYLSTLLAIRDSIVHKKIDFIIENDVSMIYIANIERRERYGVFNKYLKEALDSVADKPEPGEIVPITDSRFPEFVYETTVSEKMRKWDSENVLVSFKAPVVDFVKKVDNNLFILYRELFDILLDQHGIKL